MARTLDPHPSRSGPRRQRSHLGHPLTDRNLGPLAGRLASGCLRVGAPPALLDELRQALAYPKLRRRIPATEADAFVAWLAEAASLAPDPGGPPPVRSPDPGDDYLIARRCPRRDARIWRPPSAGPGRSIPGARACELPVDARRAAIGGALVPYVNPYRFGLICLVCLLVALGRRA